MPSLDVLASLKGLAGNFRWVWDEPTQGLFRDVDPVTWERTRDPLATLRAASPRHLAGLDADAGYRARLREVEEDLAVYLAETPATPSVAYFCMEHGIAPALRTYAGGLGMLAGCIEKTASDLRVPMVAVGLRYHRFFRQRLNFGWQSERWQEIDPGGDGLEACPEASVVVDLAGEAVAVRVWRAQVGRVPLYLLDTDVPENPPHLRQITDGIYVGDKEHRLRQEMILGIGGVRVLAALGLEPEVYHANEGHAGFMALERVRRLVAAGVPLDEAIARVRGGTVFTTHTAVAAGFDLFERGLIEKYFGAWAAECGMSVDRLMDLGHFPGQHPDEPFNMALLCTKLSAQVNAVSRLHREVTEAHVLGPLWPGRAAPVVAVTNGVHPRTWTPPAMADLYDRYVGPGWDYAGVDAWEGVWDIPDEDLWQVRRELRAGMVESLRAYLPEALREQGWADDLDWATRVLDPGALTVVIARRAAEYKETDLLVSMPDRLAALTSHHDRPVNVIFSGLAHPSDGGGKERIRRIVEYSLRPEVRHNVVYLPGYDMRLAQVLLSGADIWLNHPRRGDEACGTSFMKSVYAGGLVATTADGGADELIVDGANGWIIGDRTNGASRETMAHNAFAVLERSAVARFYDRGPDGVPTAWTTSVKRSLATLAWQVGSGPMVRTYHRMYRDAARLGMPARALVTG